LQLTVDGVTALGASVSLVERVEQGGPDRTRIGVRDGEFGHADRVVAQLPVPCVATLTGHMEDFVEGASGDADRNRRQHRDQHRVDGQPPQRAVRPCLVGEAARVIEIGHDVARGNVVVSRPSQARGVPGVLHGQLGERDEDDPREWLRLAVAVHGGTETSPCTVQAVARERPAARQPATAPLGVDGAGRGEHRGVALIGIGADVPSACLGQVAREHVAAGSDRRAPTGAPIDHGDGFH
jgi:hypothetical protein